MTQDETGRFKLSREAQEMMDRVKQMRLRRGWTQSDVAKKLDIHPTTYSNMENGARTWITTDEALALAKMFKANLNYLMLGKGADICHICEGSVPPGYTCNSCGARGKRR